MLCRICGGKSGAERFTAREMMFGTREKFDYVLCNECSTLQIAEIPDELGKYYQGSTYYSFNQLSDEPSWKTALKRFASASMVGKPSAFPKGNSLLDRVRRGAEPWTAHIAGLKRNSAILDLSLIHI